MAKSIPEAELAAIEAAVSAHPDGASIQEIVPAVPEDWPRRTLQYRLKHLVETGRLTKRGEGRWTTYHTPAAPVPGQPASNDDDVVPLSPEAAELRAYLRQPPARRTPTGYNRGFLTSYRPGVTHYLTDAQRAHLATVGQQDVATQPAGTYARHILNRLLIDLSWNSSRLEGNTYSLLDTRRLIEFGEEAEGRERLEAQMILNHKDAIEFLIDAAEDITFNRYTILNLHAILANNLLADESAAGRLRRIGVGIESSVFHPLEVPQLIEECFDEALDKAAAIQDPFEQALFAMVQLPYLQPFDDVNKRVSRLAANIPLIKRNLTPLAFTDVPRALYTSAVLGVYERNQIDLLRDVFIWAYERSAARYAAVRQSLGEPNPFRLQYREALRTIIGAVIRERMNRKTAAAHIADWAKERVPLADRETFRQTAETELLSLHDGNYARYRIRPTEFTAWQEAWQAK